MPKDELAREHGCDVRTVRRIHARSKGDNGNADLKQSGGDRKSSPHANEMVSIAVEVLDGEECVDEKDITRAWFEKLKEQRSPNSVRNLLKQHGVVFRSDNDRKAADAKPAAVGSRTDGKFVRVRKGFLKNNVRRKMENRLGQRSVPEGIKRRCRLLLALNDGYSAEHVAGILRVGINSIYKWLGMHRKAACTWSPTEGMSECGTVSSSNWVSCGSCTGTLNQLRKQR